MAARDMREALARFQGEIATAVAPPEVFGVILNQLRECRNFILEKHFHRNWDRCTCEACPRIRILMGTHCPCEQPQIPDVGEPCLGCGLPENPRSI